LPVTTDGNGFYQFNNLTPGIYTVTQTQPAMFLNGIDSSTGAGGSNSSPTDNTFTLNLTNGTPTTSNNFGERGLLPQFISKRGELSSTNSTSSNSSSASLNLAAKSAWYSLDAGYSGTLTAQVEGAANAGTAQVTLYDSGLHPLASSAANSSQGRIDWNGTPGAPYFLLVSGTNTDADLTLTNLVSLDGSTVRVNGTAGDDHFEFNGSSPNRFSINGVTYELNPANVSSLVFTGGGGHDTATLTGSSADDVATVAVGIGSLVSAMYNVQVDDVESLTVDGAGGNDRATLHDSALADSLQASGHAVTVSNSLAASTLRNFETVNASSTHGGGDTKTLQAIDFVLSRDGVWA
jgi:hypothetical protein